MHTFLLHAFLSIPGPIYSCICREYTGVVYKRMSIFNLQRFIYNIQRVNEYFLQQKFAHIVTIGDNTSTTVYLRYKNHEAHIMVISS